MLWGGKSQYIEKYRINMNYVDHGAFGKDRAEIPAERGRPDAARVWSLRVFSGETEIYVTGSKPNANIDKRCPSKNMWEVVKPYDWGIKKSRG